jgi:hypothetical protein
VDFEARIEIIYCLDENETADIPTRQVSCRFLIYRTKNIVLISVTILTIYCSGNIFSFAQKFSKNVSINTVAIPVPYSVPFVSRETVPLNKISSAPGLGEETK